MTFSSDFDPDSIIRTASRLPERPKLSSAEIKRRAETYLIQPPSAELLKTYRLTSTAGVIALMHYQALLSISPRTIRKYVELGVLERLPDRTPKLRKLGFTESNEALRLYTLGPVGHAMAEMESIIAPSGYHAVVDRVTHDFLATYAIIRFLQAAEGRGFKWEWRNRYQATLQFTRGNRSIEPDAALRLTHSKRKEQSVLILELHNEDHSKRVAEKLYHYRLVGDGSNMQTLQPWWDEPKPTLIAVSPYAAPINAYYYAFTDPENHAYPTGGRGELRANYLPKNPVVGGSLTTLWKQSVWEVWTNLRTGTSMNIFTGAAVPRP
jgi:hypothetical protein